ncbi:MAG: gluconate 2-dehydrogenase subunit 3 family protein [Saprospiraceae bacterium]|nr:gluconate 2-dehydrogenase subunit 3 family protein [Saprospiraceae bacterium]
MDRRTALKKASLILGYSLSAPAIVGIMQGCKPEVIAGFEPSFFLKNDLGLVNAFMDTIIPRTDSPSASEVGVLSFMDAMLDQCTPEDGQEAAKVGIARIKELAGGTAFESLSQEDRNGLLSTIEKEAADDRESPISKFWFNAKGLIINGYLLSEKIGTEYLAYDPIPGLYNGCVDMSVSNGRAWAL